MSHLESIQIQTEDDVRKLSYYTLCKLVNATGYASPIHALPPAIRRGEFKGQLLTDRLGNFISFE